MIQTVTTLEFLQMLAAGRDTAAFKAPMSYPPGIWETLGLRLVEVDAAFAKIALDADPHKHGNPMGTIHGGVLCEMADAAIGAAHSTVLAEDETFASLEFKVNFLRPAWQSRLVAAARRLNAGRTLSYYVCNVVNQDGKLIAATNSTVMTLRGDRARGR